MGEILEAGRALDIRIARDVLNKRPCHFREVAHFSAWATGWQCLCKTTEECYPENQDAIEHAHSPLSKYSQDFRAAWEILTSSTSKFRVFRGLSSRTGADFKLCLDYPQREKYWLEYMTPSGLKTGPEAMTPAMAICLAALECVSIA